MSDKMNVHSQTSQGMCSHKESLDNPSIRHITIDFGKCPVYGQYVKKFPLDDLENTKSFCYKIIPDAAVDPIYRFFSFNKYEGISKPGEHLKLKILYDPVIPQRRDVENFEFVDSSFNIVKIKVVGECIGPVLKASVKELFFLITPSEKTYAKTLELKNISDVSAEFSFDIDEKHSIFSVEPARGTLKNQRNSYIHIRFTPKEYGSYSEHLFCLIWGGAPLLIKLRGVYRETDFYELTTGFQSYSMPPEYTFGYKAYMQDCYTSKNLIPPVSLSRNYIDFGRVLLNDERRSNFKFVTLRNNLDNNIIVKWPNDENFEIVPKKAQILPTEMVAFRCNFSPITKNMFFSKNLTAQIKWIPKTVHGFVLPLTTTIKLQGHSFPENEYWIPNVEVRPRVITLPACIAEDPSYATFKITTLGHLPVMYKLIPPQKTSFFMKPMVGIVKDYQIVVIQLYWEGTEENKLFKEVWHVELNDCKEKRIPITIAGEISLPKIIIGDNNTIRFDLIQPGCQSVVPVPLKNISCYQLRYEFTNKQYDCLKIIPPEGIIPSNDEVIAKCSYIGNLSYPKKIKIKCKLQRILKMQECVGPLFSQKVTIFTKCRYQELCSTPTYYNFGQIQLDTFLETEFYIFNFGEMPVNFVLKIIYTKDNLDRLHLKPSFGEIESKAKKKICIKGLAQTLGDRIVTIAYNIRKNNYMDQEGEDESVKLFEMHYAATLPVLQIGSIVEHNFGILFSKKQLWDFLKVEQLNDHLQNMSKGEKRSIILHLPEAQVSDETYFVTVEMENKSDYEMDVNLERKQLCNCKLKEVAVNINTIKRKFDCIHREMLTMELTEPKFYKNTQHLLTIRVRYLLPGETQMRYVLQLPHSRSIEISFIIVSIPTDVLKISSYKTDFNIDLRGISICRRVPPIQICWFYNNTSQTTPYKIDVTNLTDLCQTEGFEVLKCVNPKGTVDPYSALPLMLKFQPIEAKEYTVYASLICGDQIQKFYIKGTGQHNIGSQVFQTKMPHATRRSQHFPAVLSHDYIPINSIPTWSLTERVIFIKNTSKDKIYDYIWEDFFFRVGINDIVELTVVNKLGTLHPQESHAVVIKIKTFNEACITTLQLSCHFVDNKQLLLHRKSLEENALQQLKNESFTEDNNEENPLPIIFIEHPKPFIRTIIISLHIVHANDRDNFFTIEEQFSNNPQDEIQINVANILNSDTKNYPQVVTAENEVIQSEDKIKIETILEQLIADFVFSNSLQEILEYSHKLSPPVYRQFTLDERKIIEKKRTKEPLNNDDLQVFRLEQIKKLFTRPKPSLVSQVVKNLIINGLHDSFKLGTFDPVRNEDADEVKSMIVGCPTTCKCKKANVKKYKALKKCK